MNEHDASIARLFAQKHGPGWTIVAILTMRIPWRTLGAAILTIIAYWLR